MRPDPRYASWFPAYNKGPDYALQVQGMLVPPSTGPRLRAHAARRANTTGRGLRLSARQAEDFHVHAFPHWDWQPGDKVRCVWSFRDRSPGNDWHFSSKLSKDGPENSNHTVVKQRTVCHAVQPTMRLDLCRYGDHF